MGCHSHKEDSMPAELYLSLQRDKLLVKIGTNQKEVPYEKHIGNYPSNDPATWHPHHGSFAHRRGCEAPLRKRAELRGI
jgi:hypothetical protein